MLEQCLKAGIPIVSVTSDDLVNFDLVIATLAAPRLVRKFPTSKIQVLHETEIYWTDDLEQVTPENYRRILKSGTQLIVLNPDKTSSLMVNAGELPTPQRFLKEYLKGMVADEAIPGLLHSLKGCSIKTCSELVQLAAATYGEITPKSLNSMRMKFSGATPGLFPLPTDVGYWYPQKDIELWLAISLPYMRSEVQPVLQPKGLMLHGLPGTGKSMAAKVIAREFGVPAFRLDMATTLNRYIGESEQRMARNLDLLTQYAPCVVLLDEVEKVFTTDGDQGTSQKLLSQLLWWLQERRTPCPVIMTTNKLSAIPPELYRDGRLDQVVLIPPLDMPSARHLGKKVLSELVGPPSLKQHAAVNHLFGDQEGQYIPAAVNKRVVSLIKENKWA